MRGIISTFDNRKAIFRLRRYISFVTSHQRELFFGLIRIHVLLHASHEPIFGLAMMEELEHHGYRIGPGTLYPLLHGLERTGLVKSSPQNVGGRRRRVYKITSAGKKALVAAKEKVDELHEELHEEHPRRVSSLSESSGLK
jgi:DNA-binding PadR family transcriptional regulator